MNYSSTKDKIKCIIFISGFLLTIYSNVECFGQAISTETKLFPEEVTTQDSVFLFAVVVHITSGCTIIGAEIEYSNDSITVKSCSFYGDAGTLCVYRDTIFLGHQFQERIFHVTYIASFTHWTNNTDTMCFTALPNPALHDTAYYSFTVLPTTSIRELTGFNNVSLLPNPATSYIHLAFESPLQSSFDVQIFDLSGHLQKQLILTATDNPEVDVSSLSPGIYFLKLMDGEGYSETLKFVKL